jgi:hypothetical protein
MRTLRIEMNRGRGWELRAEGRIPADITVEQIEHDLHAYAVQYRHRALLDGVEVARVEVAAVTAPARGMHAVDSDHAQHS